MVNIVQLVGIALALASLAAYRPGSGSSDQPADSARALVSVTLDSAPQYRGQSTVSFAPDTDGVAQYVIRNQQFLMATPRRPPWQRDVLLRETRETKCCSPGERWQWTTITLEAWPDPESPARAPTWELTLDADEGELWDKFYCATLHGCCDAAARLAFVHLPSGQVTFTATREIPPRRQVLFLVRVPNTRLRRYVAFHDMYTFDDPPEASRIRHVVGVLQYGPAEGPVQRLVITAEDSPMDFRLERLRVAGDGMPFGDDSFDLWGASGRAETRALSGFTIEVLLTDYSGSEGVIVRVPVREDRLHLSAVEVPERLQAVASPLTVP